VLTYQTDRVKAAQAGNTSPLTVRVYGPDLDTLRTAANEVRQLVSTVPGVGNPQVETQPIEPTLSVEVNLDAAQRYGIKPGDVRRAAATYFSGLAVGSIYQDQKIFDVVVKGVPATQNAPSSLQDLLIDTPNGDRVRLGDVAAVRVTPYPTVIRHNATSRSLDVTADVNDRALGSVIADINSRLAHQAMPLEYHAEVLSGATTQQSQVLLIWGIVVAVLIGIFLLLQAAFGSWRLAALVLLVLPLAAVGGVLTGFGTGGILSLGALIGFLAVLAIAVPNVVVLVNAYRSAERKPEETFADVVVRTTRDRVGPVVLTALTTAVAVVPLVLFGNAAGLEVLHPLAVVVLGGLVSSTLVALFLLPSLYLRFASAQAGD
jgi:Cu/Ag efflux pump CusA